MNILLADDDSTSRDLMRRIIALDPGHDLTEVYDGEEAWTMLRESEQVFDLAIIDLTMPRLDGLALVERIRGVPALRNLSIILCSAVKDRQSVQRAVQLGIRHYIVKPYSRELVLEKIRAAAAEHASHAAADTSVEAAKRLGLPPSTVQQLIVALHGKVRTWVESARQAQSPQDFTLLTITANGFRGACANLGLRTLGQELEIVEAKFTRDFCEAHGDMLPPSPLEVAEELKGVEAELARIAARLRLPG